MSRTCRASWWSACTLSRRRCWRVPCRWRPSWCKAGKLKEKYKIELAASSWPELPGNPYLEVRQLTVWRDTTQATGQEAEVADEGVVSGSWTLCLGIWKLYGLSNEIQHGHYPRNSSQCCGWKRKTQFNIRKGKILLAGETGVNILLKIEELKSASRRSSILLIQSRSKRKIMFLNYSISNTP